MSNALTASGLTTATYDELVAYFVAQLQAIYGSDIDLSQSSPDGQWMNIMIQAILDEQDLLAEIYNSMDPDRAFGVVLDSRVAFNGIQRLAGTYTITNVTIVADRALTLPGLDTVSVESDAYTVADNAGNKWRLIATQSPAGPGTYVYAFRAANPGAVLTTVNTITVPVSIVLGVSSINNPTTYTSSGLNEETDAALKIRRQKSVSLASQGFLAGLLAALRNINGVTSAFVYENNTGTTDLNGVPGHSIWVIVAGTFDPNAVANAIYLKRNAGCGMKGAQSAIITQADGSPFIVNWDIVASENLYVKFSASSLDGVTPPNLSAILAGLPTIYGVNEEVNINALATLIQAIDPNCLVTGAGFSLTQLGTYKNSLSPSSKKNQFNVVATYSVGISPFKTAVVGSGQNVSFTASNGLAPYVYSMASGAGSVNPSTGVYTSAGPGTDVVQVTDAVGNVAQATVTVT